MSVDHTARRANDLQDGNPGDSWGSNAPAWPAGAASLTLRQDGTRVTISLSGEIHAANARSLQKQLSDLIDTYEVQDVVINLAGVDFCDLAALRVLFGTQQYAIGRAVGCEFVCPSPAIVHLTRLLYGEASPLGI